MTKNLSNTLEFYAAHSITIIFHPLFMPAYGLLIMFETPTLFLYLPLQVKKILMLIIFVNNVLLPVAILPFLRYRNIINSWMMETTKERIVPLLLTSILYTITSFLIMRLSVPTLIKSYFYSITLLVIVILIITIWYKISIHAACAGALTGLVIALWIVMEENLVWFLIPVILISGLILTARLYLKAHTTDQVYSGYLTGFVIVTLVMLCLK